MKRFTAYRRQISQRDTHNEFQKNPDSEPQFEGVLWTDGTVTLRWLTPIRAHSVWASLFDALAIHGHPEYGTEIVWHDWDSPPQEWLDQVAAVADMQRLMEPACGPDGPVAIKPGKDNGERSGSSSGVVKPDAVELTVAGRPPMPSKRWTGTV